MELPALFLKEKTPEAWVGRRAQLKELLAYYEYGETPRIELDETAVTTPLTLSLEDGIQYETHRAFFKKGEQVCSMRFEIWHKPGRRPLPSVLVIDVFDTNPANMQMPMLSNANEDRCPYKLLAQRGYALVVAHTNDLCDDTVEKYKRGIMEIAPREGKSGWGAIGAWAWGASRIVDFLRSDERFDPEQIAVLGVSRAGKTALWCAAQDERIAATIAVVSGCGGASLLRGKTGEHLRDMTAQFPHWTCPRCAEYIECEEELPIDQHMLLALCAPRPLYLSDAIEDDWADPHKAFEAAQLASEAWCVLGGTGLRGDKFPDVHEPLLDGDIAYHVRTGGHGLKRYDWEQYLKFLDRIFKASDK